MRITHPSSTVRMRRRLIATALAGSLLLVACGGDASDDAEDSVDSGDRVSEAPVSEAPVGEAPVGEAPVGGVPVSEAPVGEQLPSVTVEDVDANEDGGDMAPVEAADPEAAAAGRVDLVGESVVAEAEVPTNLLPSVVVDDLQTGEKVNFRNLVPQDKPILLWMWAPH